MTAGSGEALRQQLADALLWRWGPRSDVERQINARIIVDVVMPAVEAALAAARVATATEIAEAVRRVDDGWNSKAERAVISACVEAVHRVAGGSVPAPQQAYCKSCDRWHVPGKHDPVPAPKGDQ